MGRGHHRRRGLRHGVVVVGRRGRGRGEIDLDRGLFALDVINVGDQHRRHVGYLAGALEDAREGAIRLALKYLADRGGPGHRLGGAAEHQDLRPLQRHPREQWVERFVSPEGLRGRMALAAEAVDAVGRCDVDEARTGLGDGRVVAA